MPAETPGFDKGSATLLVAGGTLLDESVTLQDSLQPGESNRAHWSNSIGGVACNVFRAAAPLTKASLISALGDDDIGHAIKLGLETSPLADHCSFTFKTDSNLATGRYTAVLDNHGELVIGLANDSATDALQAEDILQAMAAQQGLQLLAVDTNLSASCLKDIGHCFRSAEATSNTKLAAIAVSPVKCMRLADLGDCIDYLFLNRQEAAMLTGKPGTSTLAQLSDALLAMHFNAHVLSDGAADLLVHEVGVSHLLPVKPLTLNRACNNSVKGSVNGAGDALAGASLALLSQGRSLLDSVREKGLTAAQTVLGGHSGLPWPTAGKIR